MKPWIRAKYPLLSLFLILVIALLGWQILNKTAQISRYSACDRQIEAAVLMSAALEFIRDYRLSLGLNIDRDLDPNQTGLIGEEFTEFTTTLGNLESKRTSTNPSFAALMVRYFNEMGLQKGDAVAVGASGSFPGLILAVLAAARIMELEPLLIYSLGSSMYGANIGGLTFDQILVVLKENGFLPYELAAVSPGGGDDRGEGIPLTGPGNALLAAAKETGVRLIYEDTLGEAIKTRLQIFAEKRVRCFVNIGGASANYGNTSASLAFPDGFVRNYYSIPDNPERGLIFEFAARGIPVINLLNVRGLALKNGLTVDPVPLPPPGVEKVYYQISYNKFLAIIVLVILVAAACYILSSQGREGR